MADPIVTKLELVDYAYEHSELGGDYHYPLKREGVIARGGGNGFNQVFVPYDRAPRYSGESKFPIFGPHVFWYFLESAFISFSSIPLKLMIGVGTLVSFFSFLMLCYVSLQRIFVPEVPHDWATIMAVMLFLGGVQLLSLGIVGLYVNIIFIEVKGRPRHIVKDTFGFPNNS